MIIKPLERQDYDQWHPLWIENCHHKIDDERTEETWRRICHPKEPVHGLGVFEGETLCGFLHYILHPVTGHIEPVCYMQDLYIDQAHRRCGLARRLVWELGEIGKQANWARIYWLADETNEKAQNLYKNLGFRINFSLHMLPTREGKGS